ncbi:hypothetical protein FOPG_07635 [Fusarium oxysporum f. sp. conglutinans race 2 54008]|uniref:Uncharacterized protein n=6 Tax=Fusarium oxysporum TaxID=5507 RepID=A0A8H6LJ50_FUSOX|nr:hypothetical protein FOXG_18726 [Fusarium oxysporum f. sp. lycopersici 4287]EXA43300.1 hypothetical protein FOVG_08308 [Fusarium oxysporum f. sp. pisi HDV247]EXK44439.1 hypothetical protein FOMG_03156 [Fusarium oxysporum f. sp. melonis 26406]EXL77966.1 hypothetical protein FOPG_07635 [Fusarium oxysporum f. sp. conglutinans race 2 54008]EXM17712.1 hypothetical protein FOTG_14224 [Fusarium oxysporum f. sp. vasinfectum 25433]KAF6522647.1 hypothetical protein HZS61_014175 [Fusarium oxysporum f.
MPTPSPIPWHENPLLPPAVCCTVIAAILWLSIFPNAPGDFYRWVTIDHLRHAAKRGIEMLTKFIERLELLQRLMT